MGSSIVVAPRAEPARETARYIEKSRRGVRSGRRRAYSQLVALLLAVNSSRSLAGVSVKDQARTSPHADTIQPGAHQPGRKRLRVDNRPSVTDVDQHLSS